MAGFSNARRGRSPPPWWPIIPAPFSDLLGGTVLISDAADLTLTVPADATEDLPAGVPVRVIRTDAGAVTAAGESGVTLRLEMRGGASRTADSAGPA